MSRVVIKWNGNAAEAVVDAAIGRGIDKGLDIIAETSQDRVLVQTGELKRSNKTSRGGNSGTVYYTDSKAVGAHENLKDTPHRNRNPNAQAKFLESALNDKRGEVIDAIADEIKRSL